MSAHTKRRRQAVRFDAAAVKDGKAQIPTRALRFEASVEFQQPAADGTVPITVRARSGNVVNHWYFGRIIHDFAGMKLASAQLPLDYCHDEKEILGFTNQVDTSSGELVVSGVLITFKKTDRAAEVIHKSGRGFQYQASIYFDAQELVLEFVPEGFSAEVNGGQVEGPIVIARQWVLRGNAICPYGQDPQTSVQFSLSKPGDLVAVTFSETSAMKKKPTQLSSKPAPNRHERRKTAALSAKGGKPKTKLSKPSPKPAGKSKTKFEAGGDEEEEEDAGEQSDEDEEGQQAAEDDEAGDEAGDEESDCDCPEGEECDCDEAGSEDEPVDEMESDDEEGQQTKHSAKPKKTKLSAKKPAQGKPQASGKFAAAAAELKRYITAFGPQGGIWFSEGKTFAQAQTLFSQQLSKENAELQKKLAEQAAQLSAFRGEEFPVSADPADSKKTKQAAPTNGLTAGQSKFASSFKVAK
jgi:hypothetical protein